MAAHSGSTSRETAFTMDPSLTARHGSELSDSSVASRPRHGPERTRWRRHVSWAGLTRQSRWQERRSDAGTRDDARWSHSKSDRVEVRASSRAGGRAADATM